MVVPPAFLMCRKYRNPPDGFPRRRCQRFITGSTFCKSMPVEVTFPWRSIANAIDLFLETLSISMSAAVPDEFLSLVVRTALLLLIELPSDLRVRVSATGVRWNLVDRLRDRLCTHLKMEQYCM